MIPIAGLLKSGTKLLSTSWINKIVSPKKNVSSAKPKFSYDNEAQTFNKAFFKKTSGPNQKLMPKVTTAMSTVSTTSSKLVVLVQTLYYWISRCKCCVSNRILIIAVG